MKIEGAIFDFDGTLVDSMKTWHTLGRRYLIKKGYSPDDNLWENTKTMSIFEVSKYFHNVYGLRESEGQIINELNGLAEEDYQFRIPLKDGVRALLETLNEKGIPMVIASATDRYLVENAVSRLGLEDYFLSILSCSDICVGKEDPQIFYEALDILETSLESTIVFEDALHAVIAAKTAGFPVVAVFDESAADEEDEIREYADWYLETIGDWVVE